MSEPIQPTTKIAEYLEAQIRRIHETTGKFLQYLSAPGGSQEETTVHVNAVIKAMLEHMEVAAQLNGCELIIVQITREPQS